MTATFLDYEPVFGVEVVEEDPQIEDYARVRDQDNQIRQIPFEEITSIGLSLNQRDS